MNIMKKMKASTKVVANRRIVAAGEDDDMMLDDSAVEMLDSDGGDSTDDMIDDLAGAVDDLQDSVDEVKQDDESIEVANNIDEHFIAECERCQGIFISAVKQSDSAVEYVHGTCPLCQEDTDQYLKWVINKV